MRTEHSLKIALIPYSDGSYIVEFSYWLPLEGGVLAGGHFQLVAKRTVAPDAEAVAKVINSLLPYASYKPYACQGLTT